MNHKIVFRATGESVSAKPRGFLPLQIQHHFIQVAVCGTGARADAVTCLACVLSVEFRGEVFSPQAVRHILLEGTEVEPADAAAEPLRTAPAALDN